MTLTPRQQEIYDFIVFHWTRHGGPPTKRNIQDRFEWSSRSAVDSHLTLLAQKNVIQLSPIGPPELVEGVKQLAKGVQNNSTL